MSANRIVQQAMTNEWLEEQGVPNMRTIWIKLYCGPNARNFHLLRPRVHSEGFRLCRVASGNRGWRG
ncbi:MAG: hypothetical protein MUC65_01085 [Pontiellaceae bacterium]|nr:hypothetical protein [Pontiellaceae bacterium]